MPETTYSLLQIATLTKGTLIMNQKEPPAVRDLLIDSRRLTHPETTLFISLVSRRNDGHRYISEMFEKGVRNFLVSHLPATGSWLQVAASPKSSSVQQSSNSQPNFIVVKDTLVALQALGAYHRAQFQIPVIGITGSNGKTIIKEWLFQLMSGEIKIIRSPKSYNSQIGVPLSVWKMSADNELAIFEAGISEPGEMEKLEPVIQPDIGLFANIGHAHDENFRSLQQKVSEKLKLFSHSHDLIYCKDHPIIHEAISKEPSLEYVNKFSWSRKNFADLQVISVTSATSQTVLHALFQGEEVSVSLPFVDEASIENAIHCWAIMLFFHYPNAVIRERMAILTPIAMRMELKEAIQHCSLINDSYNSDINSLGVALDFLNQQKQHRKKTIILSDILQSGREPEEFYGEIAEILSIKGISRIIGIGPEISQQADKFPMEKVFFNSTDDFLLRFPVSSFRNEAILLKGARIFEFERIDRLLQQKVHETILEVNLDAMVHNLNYYRSKLQPGTRTMAMVKAFSYGSGSFEIANLLQFNQVDYLAVAYADEGVELRKSGISVPIMVMNPEEDSFDLLLKYRLEPEIFCFRVLEMLEKSLIENPPESEDSVKIHVKLDTGMHRLGFEPKDLDILLGKLTKTPGIIVQSVFSHLAASEDPHEDIFTQNQIAGFNEMVGKIQRELGYKFLTHIQNSAGISRFPDAGMDMVRLGIGLYGVGFNPDEQSHLRNVSTLKSTISQIKHVKAGETIGYNRKGITTDDTWIAIVPVGYADGLNRRLSNGTGRLSIHGFPAPVIGNISMDTCMVDITEIRRKESGNPIREGDEVIVFGNLYPIAHLAHDLETIPYEILTSISRRVKRIYFHE